MRHFIVVFFIEFVSDLRRFPSQTTFHEQSHSFRKLYIKSCLCYFMQNIHYIIIVLNICVIQKNMLFLQNNLKPILVFTIKLTIYK